MPLVKLLREAEIELLEAAHWYEKQQEGLSLKFRKEIKSTLDIICSNPLLYAPRYKTELRFAVVKKFPFIIIFKFDENLNTILVGSIFNTNRDSTKYITTG